jgi:DUF4097 and DUF4098 domain-containing protein YvlB
MVKTKRRPKLRPRTLRYAVLTHVTVFALALGICSRAQTESTFDFRQTFMVTTAAPVILEVEILRGELQVFYSHDGELSITGSAQTSSGAKLDDAFFRASLVIEQNGNHFKLRCVPDSTDQNEQIHVRYRIDVPYRTEVKSWIGNGRQSFSGIMGPVHAVSLKGDIKASYLSKGVQARTNSGNIDLQVIGERVEAQTGDGNIFGQRLAQGISAETEDGDISLTVVGPSTAIVKKGTGRIDANGARGTFTGATDGGELHIKAVPHGDWQLNSKSGNIRIEFPILQKLELDASTDSGLLQVDRDDILKPDPDSRHFHQKINGGGSLIEAHTSNGKILIPQGEFQ